MNEIKSWLKKHLLIVKAGLLTGLVVVLFELINLFVIYRYIKLDYYLSLVAVAFLMAGLLINKNGKQAEIQKPNPAGLLTAKEVQILQLIAEGKTNKEIAAVHFIEISTVKTHINNIYSKLSLTSRKEARIKYEEMTRKGSFI